MVKNMKSAIYTRVGNKRQVESPRIENMKIISNRLYPSPKIIIEGDFQYLDKINKGLYKIEEILNRSK